MSKSVPSTEPASSDIADYIADLCGELVRLAKAERLDMLAYLLGMAQLEADSIKQDRAKRTGGRMAGQP